MNIGKLSMSVCIAVGVFSLGLYFYSGNDFFLNYAVISFVTAYIIYVERKLDSHITEYRKGQL
jgi:hypothetical protein